jgi:hypothetical protein
MTANFSPIFGLTPNLGGIGNTVTTAANVAFDGTGTVITALTTGSNGDYVDKITFIAQSGASSNNVASVARIFVNNGSTQATPTNNLFIGEVTLPATTGSAVAALPPIVFPINRPIQGGYKINWCLGTAVAVGYWANANSISY